MKLHLFQFDDKAAAVADPLIGPFHIDQVGTPDEPVSYAPESWHGNVFPDTSVYLSGVLQSGWWAIVASDESNSALAAHQNCRIAWDNEDAVVLGGTFVGNEIASMAGTEPVPAGSYNPWP